MRLTVQLASAQLLVIFSDPEELKQFLIAILKTQ